MHIQSCLCVLPLSINFNSPSARLVLVPLPDAPYSTQWMRNLSYWRHFRNYFPVTVHKTADLPADRNYMIGLFPHGLLR